MAVLGRLLVSSAERLDLPDLLSLDSYAAGDWKFFLKGLVGDTKPYILKGFDIVDPGNAIGTQSCSIRVADSVVFYPGSNSGSFFHGLQEGHAQAAPLVPELRKNAVNYVYLTFSTFNTSTDTRAFWDPDKDGGVGGEFTQDINTESVLKVDVNVSTGSFPANTIPIAKITVGPVVITAIEDARDLMFRLGSGGINPNPFNTYAWRSTPGSQYARQEPPTQMLAGGINPFQGADKNILTLKEWMDAIMSKLRELGGTTYWYDDTSSFSIITNFYDAVATAFKSKGKWVHDTITPGLLTWTEDIQIKMTSDPRAYIVRQGSKTLTDEQVMYIPMERNLPLNVTDENVSWINGQVYVNTIGGAVGLFANLSKGDYIKKANDTIDKWVRVEEFYDAVNLGGSTTIAANARSVRLSSAYLGSTGSEKGRYDKGVYLPADIIVSNRNDAAIANTGGNFHWLALRSDTIENIGNAVTTSLSIAIDQHDGTTARVTSVGHGLADGDRVTITNTTNFNGIYEVEVETPDIFYINIVGAPFADESGDAHYAIITTVARSTPYGFQEESANHGFNSDDTIAINGTVGYNGSFKINVRSSTQFTIPMPGVTAPEVTGTATLAKVIVRTEGAVAQIIQGQVIDIGGSVADNIRQYVGMSSLSETAPTYSVPTSYNTLDGMANYNGVINENLTARVSKLTAMMSDKAQDKTIKYLPSNGIVSISNTQNGSAQELRFLPDGASLTLVTPSSDGQAFVALPGSTTPVSLLQNQVAYIQIDRNNASSPTIQVSSIVDCPLDENTFVLAVRINTPDIYIWEGSIIEVGSIPGPGFEHVVTKQDRNLKLVRGGMWSWDLVNSELSWNVDASIQIPGLPEARNNILAGNITLSNDGDVAYVDINRTFGANNNLVVSVSPASSLTLTTDRVIIARRIGDNIIVGTGTMLLTPGDYKALDADDKISRVEAVDIVSTVLPSGVSVTIDGITLSNGNKVLFTSAVLNGIYVVDGIGTAATWTKIDSFAGDDVPFEGALVACQNGTSAFNTLWAYFNGSWKTLDNSQVTKEPTGFPNRTDTILSFDDMSRTFSITPSSTYFDIYQQGKAYRYESAQSIVIPDTEGLHYLYFNNGVLITTQTFSDNIITQYVFVATVQWDATNKLHIMLGDERHGLTMDGATHKYLHTAIGARYISGLSAGNFTLVGAGASDSDAQLSISNGTICDEDISLPIVDAASPTNPFEQILDPVAEIPVYYRDGAAGHWRKDTATAFPVKQGITRITYNDPAGPWTTPDASTDGNFVAMWLFATNNQEEPIIALLGQREDATLNDAQANNTYESISFGDLPSLEMKVLYRLIFESNSTYTNTVKARLADITDLRRAVDVSLGTYAPGDHGLLTGLTDQDHPDYSIYVSNPAAYVGGLKQLQVGENDDVEKALQSLDRFFAQMRIAPHISDPNRVVISGASQALTNGITLTQTIKNLMVAFDGAEIDFASGNIYGSDGITPLGLNFTPATIAAGQYRWYSITAIASSVNTDNTINLQLTVLPANSDGASPSVAPKAAYANGIQLGQVYVQKSGGGIAAITVSNISSIGFTSGAGGGASPKIVGGGTISLETIIVDGFSIGTGFTGSVNSVAVQSDGKILVGGGFFSLDVNVRNRLVRLNTDGTEDTGFYSNLGSSFNSSVNSVAVQSDGKILVGGTFTSFNGNVRNRLVRLNTDGTEDTGFYSNLGSAFGFSGQIRSIAVQSDGKILVGGSFFSFNGNSRNRLVRLNTDGTEDTGFYSNLGSAFGSDIFSVAIQSNNQIVVSGTFTSFNGNVRNRLVRLNTDGTEDTGFYSNLGTGFSGVIRSVAIQSNNQILVGGSFSSFNGNVRNRLVRLNTDGTEDTGFYSNLGSAFSGDLFSVAVQSNGQIVVGGQFGLFNGNTRNYLVHLNADGTEDVTFYTNLGTGFTSGINTIVVKSNSQILVGGLFGFFDGNTRGELVSLNTDGTETPTISVNTANLAYTSDFYVEIPGFDYADNTIQTALSPIAFTADQQVAYVVPNPSSGGPALPITVTTLPNVPVGAVILARREGTEVVVGSSSTRFSNGESKKLYAGVSDQLLSAMPASSNADGSGQLRLLANSTPDKKVNVSAVNKIVPDGTEYSIQIKNLLLNFEGAVIDFSTGAITDKLGGALGVNFTPATIASSQYRWYSVTLVPANVGGDGRISGQLVVIAGASDGATAATAPRAAFATGIQLGQVVVQESGGSIAVIPQSSIVQLSAGGSGSGTGDANSLMEDIKAYLRDSSYMWATPNIISLQGKTLIDTANTSATYDIANSWYEIDAGQTLRTTQQFGAQFLASTRDCQDIEVNLGYDVTGVDPNPSVYASRNGGNAWQQVTVDRVGASNKFRGSLTFTAETDQVIDTYAIANADGAVLLNNTNYKAVAQKFEPTSKVLIRKLTFRFEKVGSPTGNVNLKIIKDVAGSPSADLNDIVYATTMSASSFAAGVNNRSFTMNVPLPSASYWFVFDTDDLYKAGYTGSDNIRIYQDSSTPTATRAKGYNASWVTQVFAVVYVVEGLTYDLRLRVDSSINNSKLLGSGIFFGKQSPGDVVTSSTIKQMRTTFSGDDNVYSFTLPFLPDPDFLRVYDIVSGQVYIYPAFDISGNTVTFVSGTFFMPDQSVTLLFDQSMGSGYDNSDRNRALMAENGLGGQNGNDASSPGIGIKLRSPNGQLWHIVVQDSGALLTTPITG